MKRFALHLTSFATVPQWFRGYGRVAGFRQVRGEEGEEGEEEDGEEGEGEDGDGEAGDAVQVVETKTKTKTKGNNMGLIMASQMKGVWQLQ